MLSAGEAEQSLRVRLSGRAWGRRGAGDGGSAGHQRKDAGFCQRQELLRGPRQWVPHGNGSPEKPRLPVFSDKIGSPGFCGNLAKA